MRRNDKQITDNAQIEEIIRHARICRLGLSDKGRPYIIPMNFGYRDGSLYFHSAREGRKIDILKANPYACFEVDVDLGVVAADIGCSWSTRYRSVIGFGTVEFLRGLEQKRDALDILMAHYSDRRYDYPFDTLDNTLVFRLKIEEMTGKQSI